MYVCILVQWGMNLSRHFHHIILRSEDDCRLEEETIEGIVRSIWQSMGSQNANKLIIVSRNGFCSSTRRWDKGKGSIFG